MKLEVIEAGNGIRDYNPEVDQPAMLSNFWWWQFNDNCWVDYFKDRVNCTCGGKSDWPTMPTWSDCQHIRFIKQYHIISVGKVAHGS